MTLEYIQKTTEFQIFDRKSAKIDAKGLAVVLIAFANADGGTVALGVEDDGELTGVDGMQNHLNDLLRASYDYCAPSIPTTPEYMEVTDSKGNPNHIILLRVTASMKVHANQVDEVYYRVGDKSKKLNFEQRMQLVYAKGERFYENAPVHDAKKEDLDESLIDDYLQRLDYRKGLEAFIRENGFTVQVEDFHGSIRNTHFSRNPKIAAYMHEYKLVKEFGEGVDRMYREMEEAGCPAPEYKQGDFMVYATIRQHKDARDKGTSRGASEDTSKGTSNGSGVVQVSEQVMRLLRVLTGEMSIRVMMDKLQFKSRDKFYVNYLTPALKAGLVEMTQPDSPKSPIQQYRLTEAGKELLKC